MNNPKIITAIAIKQAAEIYKSFFEIFFLFIECVEYSTGEINNIKSKKPNKFGLYDTLGNVWEWCYDSEGEKSILARINPVKKGKRYSNKIIRGGSAAENAENTTLKTRRSISPNTHNTKIGFRIVLGKKLEE